MKKSLAFTLVTVALVFSSGATAQAADEVSRISIKPVDRILSERQSAVSSRLWRILNQGLLRAGGAPDTNPVIYQAAVELRDELALLENAAKRAGRPELIRQAMGVHNLDAKTRLIRNLAKLRDVRATNPEIQRRQVASAVRNLFKGVKVRDRYLAVGVALAILAGGNAVSGETAALPETSISASGFRLLPRQITEGAGAANPDPAASSGGGAL